MRGPRKDYQRPPIARPELRELKILRVGAQGDGVAEGPVYAPFTLPGERVRAKVQAGRGELVEVLSPSPERQAPPCPHFLACGGCALQHWETSPYRAWKRELVVEALRQGGIDTTVDELIDAHGSGRRRAVFHARRGDDNVWA